MQTQSLGHFYGRLLSRKEHFPWSGQIDLTYRCNLNCIHCFCKGSEDKDKELTTQDWKKILDEIYREGSIRLTFTGGDPLLRDDFLEIYSSAKAKGFIVTIFTNGQAFTDEIIDYLEKSPPFSIQITLNGITKETYESITRIEGSFLKVTKTVEILAKKKLPLILKTNCLKQNQHEIVKIKKYTEKLLGRASANKYRFRYDPMVYPRLNGDREPCRYRLSYEELLRIRKHDTDIWKEYWEGLQRDPPVLEREKTFLYGCNSWMTHFFINPYGRLKFCMFSDKFSTDLKTTPFKEGFYEIFPQLLKERFKTDSECKECSLRPICYHCPARAYLETGDEELPVEYYCRLAKENSRQKKYFLS